MSFWALESVFGFCGESALDSAFGNCLDSALDSRFYGDFLQSHKARRAQKPSDNPS